MRFQLSRCTPVATLVAVSALSFQALAQPTPGRGHVAGRQRWREQSGARRPRWPTGPRRDCRTARRISPACGKAAVPSATSRKGLLPGEEIVMKPEAEKLMKKPACRRTIPRRAACRPACRASRRIRGASCKRRAMATRRILYFLFEGNIHSYRQIFMDGRGASRRSRADVVRPLGRALGRRHARGRDGRLQRQVLVRLPWVIRTRRSCRRSSATRARSRARSRTSSTITDPGAYTKPFTLKFTATLRPGWDLMEYICNENNQDVEHLKGPAGL